MALGNRQLLENACATGNSLYGTYPRETLEGLLTILDILPVNVLACELAWAILNVSIIFAFE